MKGFLKTFGKGILYFILSPFALIFIALFGIYLFFLNIFTFFTNLKKKNSKKEKINKLDQKAMAILKGNKYEEDIHVEPISNVTNNNIVITNKEDLMSLVKSLKEEESKKEIEYDNSKLISDESSNYVIEEKPLEVRGERVKREK